MKNSYKNMFGSGPTGVLTTILLWVLALQVSTWINIPEMKIAPTFRWILIVLFSIDAVVLLLWSHIILPPLARAKTLITTGPYQYVSGIYLERNWHYGHGLQVLAADNFCYSDPYILGLACPKRGKLYD